MNTLLVKLGAIGDVVQLAIALHYYRQQFPEHEVDWLTNKPLEGLVRSMGVARNVRAVDESSLLSGSLPSRLCALIKTNVALAPSLTTYDRIVTAYADWRYRLVTAAALGKQRKSFARTGARPALIQHRSRTYEYWRLLGGDDCSPFDIAKCARQVGSNVLGASLSEASVRKLGALPQNYVVVVAGGARNALRSDDLRRWPLENYRRLVELILRSGRQVVLAGGPTDGWVRPAFEGLPCADWIGSTSLVEMVHLLDRASAVVAHDTGPTHLTTLTNTPLVALFGPTPANAFALFGREKTAVIQLGNTVACSPCYDGRNYAACERARCMEAISVERVMRELLSIVSDKKNLSLREIETTELTDTISV